MKPIKKIVIPTDFSEYSLGVLSYLRLLDLPKDARIIFLHVLPENPLIGSVLNQRRQDDKIAYSPTAEAEQYLKELAEEWMAGFHRVECVVRRGDPAVEIVKLAEHDNAGLIMMATHGRTGLSHLLMGSVAEKVVRTSRVPVLTSKPREMRQPVIDAADVREQLHLR